MILAVVVFFIVTICTIPINSVGLNIVMDVNLAMPLWMFAMSFLPLEKKRRPYIITSVYISLLGIVFFCLILGGVDFNFGESI